MQGTPAQIKRWQAPVRPSWGVIMGIFVIGFTAGRHWTLVLLAPQQPRTHQKPMVIAGPVTIRRQVETRCADGILLP